MTTLSNCYAPLPLKLQPNHTNYESKKKEEASNKLRTLHIAMDILSQSNGSCLYESGYTKILVSVHGPRSLSASSSSTNSNLTMTKGSLNCNIKYAPYFGKHNTINALIQPRSLDWNKSTTSHTTNEEMELSSRLYDALSSSILFEKFPKCVVDVNVMILQSDGSILSSAIVASSLALVDSNLECNDLVCSSTVAVLEDEGNYICIADPNESQMIQSKGIVTLAMLAHSREVTYWDVSGRLPASIVDNALDIAKNGCHTVHRFMKQSLIHTYSNPTDSNSF